MKFNDKHNAEYWCTFVGVIVLDPDGWDRPHIRDSWDEEITYEEFRDRLATSTFRYIDSDYEARDSMGRRLWNEDEIPKMSESDIEVINDMRPDLLRQWIIEKMFDSGTIHEFNKVEQIEIWGDGIEQYIKSGKKALDAGD